MERGSPLVDMLGGFRTGKSTIGIGRDQTHQEVHQQFIANDLFGQDFIQTGRQLAFSVQQISQFVVAGEGVQTANVAGNDFRVRLLCNIPDPSNET